MVFVPVKKSSVNVSAAGFSAVLIIHSRGRKINPPIVTVKIQKNTRNPGVFRNISFPSYSASLTWRR